MSDSELENENKKRKVEQEDELEVDVEAPEPKSKKQKRLEKKGKKDIKRKEETTKDFLDEQLRGEKSINESDEGEESGKKEKGQFGVWVGNLSFDTSIEELKRFIILKTQDNDEENAIKNEDITRINMPMNRNKNKGFAYVDFDTEEQMQSCVQLSEQNLNGRNLLIKGSKNFDGRPAQGASKNPPSRILFVGNLSFDTTDQQLELHFQHCGEIGRIRMATFEDSGNCKGFAFIDFREIEAATKALADKRCRKLNGRMLRMEYGEDRSKRNKQQKSNIHNNNNNEQKEDIREENVDSTDASKNEGEDNYYQESAPVKQRKDKGRKNEQRVDTRQKPGLALATAQRGKQGIVQSTGKKVTFD